MLFIYLFILLFGIVYFFTYVNIGLSPFQSTYHPATLINRYLLHHSYALRVVSRPYVFQGGRMFKI